MDVGLARKALMTRTRPLRPCCAAVTAAFALGLAGSPAVATASPFASFSSAAADQYQSSNGSGISNGANGNSAVTAHKHKSGGRHHHGAGVNGESGSGNGTGSSGVAGANVGVAPSTHPITTHGTLPFTGLDLAVLVLVALGLLCAGLSLRAVERLNRRRRANAAS